MILNKSISKILHYNLWANQRLVQNLGKISDIDYARTLSIPFGNIHGQVAHLFHYDKKYFEKITKESYTIENLESISREKLVNYLLSLSKEWLKWAGDHKASKRQTSYLLEQELIDLTTHNNYHRGQINCIVSLMHYDPVSLDIFVFNKEFCLKQS